MRHVNNSTHLVVTRVTINETRRVKLFISMWVWFRFNWAFIYFLMGFYWYLRFLHKTCHRNPKI